MIIQKMLKNAVKQSFQRRQKVDDNRPLAALIFGGGANPGIGAAVAQHFATQGMHVFVTGRSEDKLQACVEAIQCQGGAATAIKVDASSEEEIKAAFEQVDQAGFAVDFVLHNVGTNRPGKFLDLRPEKLEKSWRADCLS